MFEAKLKSDLVIASDDDCTPLNSESREVKAFLNSEEI
jgi:hypothetical protein